MIFVSVDDFLTKASAIPRLRRTEEKELALRMIDGDYEARKRLIYSYASQYTPWRNVLLFVKSDRFIQCMHIPVRKCQ